MSTYLRKYEVCANCLSIGITDPNCICSYDFRYQTVELEFEVCLCCGNTADTPADTEFNQAQYRAINKATK